MLESLFEWMNYPLYYAIDGATPPRRTGASHATIYPYGPFPAGDGKNVMLGLQNEREWSAFCEKVLLRPELGKEERFSSNSKRSAARDELRQIIVDAFASLTSEQVIERLETAQIANAHLNTMKDVWEHPQLKGRKRWREVETAVGKVPALLPPGSWTECEPRMDAQPALGQRCDVSLLAEDRFHALTTALALEPCPALDGEARCLIYAGRPMVCRMRGLGLETDAGKLGSGSPDEAREAAAQAELDRLLVLPESQPAEPVASTPAPPAPPASDPPQERASEPKDPNDPFA